MSLSPLSHWYFFEVLDVLLSGVHPHSNILKLGMSSSSRVGIAEASLELLDKVKEGGERRRGNIDICGLFGGEAFDMVETCGICFYCLHCLITPLCSVILREEGEGDGDFLFVVECFTLKV